MKTEAPKLRPGRFAAKSEERSRSRSDSPCRSPVCPPFVPVCPPPRRQPASLRRFHRMSAASLDRGRPDSLLRQFSDDDNRAKLNGSNPHAPMFAEHIFVKKHFSRPTWCAYCGNFIWGLGKQGSECSKCKYPVHRGKCFERANRLACSEQLPGDDPEREEMERLSEDFLSNVGPIAENPSKDGGAAEELTEPQREQAVQQLHIQLRRHKQRSAKLQTYVLASWAAFTASALTRLQQLSRALTPAAGALRGDGAREGTDRLAHGGQGDPCQRHLQAQVHHSAAGGDGLHIAESVNLRSCIVHKLVHAMIVLRRSSAWCARGVAT